MEQEKNKVLQVNVVTPDGNVYDHNATIVVAKTVAGEIGILPNHAPIIAPLAIDEVRVRRTDLIHTWTGLQLTVESWKFVTTC